MHPRVLLTWLAEPKILATIVNIRYPLVDDIASIGIFCWLTSVLLQLKTLGAEWVNAQDFLPDEGEFTWAFWPFCEARRHHSICPHLHS
jgi:hypothetical protein